MELDAEMRWRVDGLSNLGRAQATPMDLARPDVFPSDQSVARMQKAHEPRFVGFLMILGRPCGIRTCDQRIKSPLLYQLS